MRQISYSICTARSSEHLDECHITLPCIVAGEAFFWGQALMVHQLDQPLLWECQSRTEIQSFEHVHHFHFQSRLFCCYFSSGRHRRCLGTDSCCSNATSSFFVSIILYCVQTKQVFHGVLIWYKVTTRLEELKLCNLVNKSALGLI